ncbi:hypothetical protein FRB95_011533 [Tulasnella sp. JGI-2019a]|nr:hypothetical protein FRB95_011533 [Tulasnella sp. JGI-2019a]
MIFSGEGLEDVATFMQNVQEVAFAQGRQRDDEWRTDYVGTRLAGAAMRWYLLLDDEIRYTWAKLCRALLQRFPPVPISLAPRAAMATMSIACQSGLPDPGTLRGRVRICSADEDVFLGYLPRQTSNLITSSRLSKDTSVALVVEVPVHSLPGQPRWNMKMINPIPYDPYCLYLGVKDTGSVGWYFVQCLQDRGADLQSGTNDPVMTSIWNISPLNDETRELYITQISSDRTVKHFFPGLAQIGNDNGHSPLTLCGVGHRIKLVFEGL